MMKRLHFLLLAACLLAGNLCHAYEFIYGDDSRTGTLFAKDPIVVFHQGRYLMYYSIPPHKSSDWEGWNIGIAESNDLKGWRRIGEITPGADYEAKGLCAPGALVRNDTIHLFYQTYGGGRTDAICHAWSTDGLTFERDPSNPIFRPTGAWNCGRAIDAEVVAFRGKYFLYFATRDPQFERQLLGVATAPLGTDFRRSDWTLALDAPILEPQLPWEGKCCEGATVIEYKKKLYMFYAANYNNCPQQIGLAVSNDGIHWQRCSDQPFLRNGLPGDWNESESGHPCVFRDRQGQTHLFYQGNNTHGKHWLLTSVPLKWTASPSPSKGGVNKGSVKGLKYVPEIIYPQMSPSPLERDGVRLVIDADAPDPSVIRVADTYYAAATSGNKPQAYQRYRSKDLLTWEPMGFVFDEWPDWTCGSFWAPELFDLSGRTMCYYTARQKSDSTSCIGVAMADGPEGRFRDYGPLVKTTNEAIDAFVFRDGTQLYITWKAYGLDPSKRPIELLCQKLSDDGLHLQGEPFMLLRDDERQGMEGQCVFREGEWWYLLYSIRDCCSPRSDYAVSVARSHSIEGPWEKYEGNPILEGEPPSGSSEGEKKEVSPRGDLEGADGGLQSCGHGTMVRTPSGEMFYLCHAYFWGRYKEGRKAVLYRLEIGDDGWVHQKK
ncbi:MAG: family 43 glycosylhydrolase [Bacteroidaceae bacterium]|nr:family 43 glycosylhydrolase [Bacteroidaceae bacterium]